MEDRNTETKDIEQGMEMCMFPSYKFHRTYTPLEKATVSSSFVILLLFIFSFSICFYENTDNA